MQKLAIFDFILKTGLHMFSCLGNLNLQSKSSNHCVFSKTKLEAYEIKQTFGFTAIPIFRFAWISNEPFKST